MTNKRVCVFTGSRANYSSTRTIMRAVQEHPQLELQTVLGAAAVLDRFGNLSRLIEEDGFAVDARVHMIVEGETPLTMAKSTGLGLMEIAGVLDRLHPDVVVVVGDRFDVLAPAVAAAFMNIPLAHTMGGEVSGTIDESIRHAITKFAHIHFPASADARERILRMGESEQNVHLVGCPRMDLVREFLESHRNGARLNQKAFFEKFKGVGAQFDLERERFLLVSQHPVTTEYGANRRHIEATLEALGELGMPVIMIWPNADAGSDEVSKGIRTFREKQQPEWLHLFINLPIDVYVKLMDLSACLVGNSSSGIREGAFIGTPVVNVGTRQVGRARGANVIDAENDATAIRRAIERQIDHGRYEMDAIYGDGFAGSRIAGILAGAEVAVQKQIAY